MADNNMSIFIPMIRKELPTLMATDIINVQPMSTPTVFGEPSVYFTHTVNNFNQYVLSIHFKVFGVLGQTKAVLDSIDEYIVNTFGSRVSKTNGLNYIFDKESDLTLFLLKWSK